MYMYIYIYIHIHILEVDVAKAPSLLDRFGHFDVTILDAKAQVFDPRISDSTNFHAESRIYDIRPLMLKPPPTHDIRFSMLKPRGLR